MRLRKNQTIFLLKLFNFSFRKLNLTSYLLKKVEVTDKKYLMSFTKTRSTALGL